MDRETATDTLCESPPSKCTWTCDKDNLMPWSPRPQQRLGASLRRSNARPRHESYPMRKIKKMPRPRWIPGPSATLRERGNAVFYPGTATRTVSRAGTPDMHMACDATMFKHNHAHQSRAQTLCGADFTLRSPKIGNQTRRRSCRDDV